MSISRVEKLVYETLGDAISLQECHEKLATPIQLVVRETSETKVRLMAAAAFELLLKSFSGKIHVHFVNQDGSLGQARDEILTELTKIELKFGSHGRLALPSTSLQHELPTLRISAKGKFGTGVDAAGWAAKINMAPIIGAHAEAPAAIFAVACGVARIFSSGVLGKIQDSKPLHFDLLNFSTLSSNHLHPNREIDFGRLALFGAGAIGTAFAYVLKKSNFRAHVDIIDDDFYDLPNHETSMSIGFPDTLLRPYKAPHLCSLLQEEGRITVNPIVERINETSEVLEKEFTIFICGVDNVDARRILDGVKAKALLNGGLGGTPLDAGHALVTRHSRGDHALSTLYPSLGNASSRGGRIPSEFDGDDCGRLNYEAVSLAAPFIALACGALLVASCAQVQLGLKIEINYLKIDLLGLQSEIDMRKLSPQRPRFNRESRLVLKKATKAPCA